MEQHPIPQQISSYEFKLVGEMTLKQFGKAAVGIVLALIISSTKLATLIKWPLMLLFGGGGAAFAFLPFEERPLEKWLLGFLKVIYSPTLYTYKRIAKGGLDIDMVKIKREESDEDELTTDKKKKKKQKAGGYVGELPGLKKKTKEKEILRQAQDDKVVKKTERKVEEEKSTFVKTTADKEDWRQKRANLDLKRQKLEATGQATFGEIPMPDIPEKPNLIVGMVTDKLGKIVEGAIVEIQDVKGNPVRVLKTNPLGQFRSSTQLANGQYLIITEKEKLEFDRVNVDLTGKIVQPVKIKAIA